jgi:hypothetical protein
MVCVRVRLFAGSLLGTEGLHWCVEKGAPLRVTSRD